MSHIIKADGTVVITARITLKPGRDDDLIALVNGAPPRGMAATIREAMRNGIITQYDDGDDDDDDEGLSFGSLGMDL